MAETMCGFWKNVTNVWPKSLNMPDAEMSFRGLSGAGLGRKRR